MRTLLRYQTPFYFAILFLAVLFPAGSQAKAEFNTEKLAPADIAAVDSFLSKKTPLIENKQEDGTLPVLNFKELRTGLSPVEKALVNAVLKLKPKDLGVKTPFVSLSPEKPKLDKVDYQIVKIKGKKLRLAPQYLGPLAHRFYEAMMQAMDQDLGKRLYLKSGFRSSAYQLYSFIFYLREHQYSLRETAKLNALPGYSEHGDSFRTAIDFISEDGLDDDSDPKLFAKLDEYKWLRARARDYGFVLSYPPNNSQGLSFEPWHWKFKGAPVRSSTSQRS